MHPLAVVRSLIVTVSIAVAACSPGGSPGPSGGASPSVAASTPDASMAPSRAPSPAALVLPTCTDPYALPNAAEIQFMTLRASSNADIRHIVATSTGSLGFVVPLAGATSTLPQEVGRAAGNRDLSFSVVPDPEGRPVPTTVLTAARASLRIGSAPAVGLASAVGGGGPRVSIPDVEGTATLDMTLAWTDGCFTYTGDLAVSVSVERGATVAACPTTDLAMQAQAGEVRQVEYQVGTLRTLLAGGDWSAKFVELDGGESAVPFRSLDVRQVPIPAAAGSSISVSEPSTLVRLVGIDAAFYRFADAQPGTYPDPVFRSTGVLHADGSVGVPAPTVPGKYVLELNVHLDGPCLTGGGQQWVVVQVT